jgi:hypothetical protein
MEFFHISRHLYMPCSHEEFDSFKYISKLIKSEQRLNEGFDACILLKFKLNANAN